MVFVELFEDFFGEFDEVDFMISEEGYLDEVFIINLVFDISIVSVSDKLVSNGSIGN